MKVLSIPAEHVYTRAIRPDGVEFLPDPDIDGNWWPHPALEASFWEARDTEIRVHPDLVHIHFGYEHRTPDELRQLVAALPVPLVVTVHDLDNPHVEDQAAHHESVGVLVEAASEVITLTDAAARIIAERYGRTDTWVIPHPAITLDHPEADMARDAAVFLKSLRTNAVADAAFYREIAARVPLTVHVHDIDETRELRAELAGTPGLTLVEHAPLDDAPLHRAVASHAVCVLPYLRGTHSGWLEMCRDLGVSVAVPDCGCYADQADTPEAVAEYAAGDGAAAGEAAADLLERGPVAYHGDRRAELEGIKQAHMAAYTAARAAGARGEAS